MNLKQHLTAGDPVAREPELDDLHAQTIRQRVLLETREAEREGFSRADSLWWLRPLAVAGALAACLVAAVSIGLRIAEREPIAPTSVGRPFQARQQPRQLQFATPGGTRIIWTLHQEFDL